MFRCGLICWIFVILVGEYSHQLLLFILDRLDGVRYENEEISIIAKKTGSKPKLNQKKW